MAIYIHKGVLIMIIVSIALMIIGFTMDFLGVTKEAGNFIGFAGLIALVISLNTQILVTELKMTREVLVKGQEQLIKGQEQLIRGQEKLLVEQEETRKEHQKMIELLRRE